MVHRYNPERSDDYGDSVMVIMLPYSAYFDC